MRADAGKRKWAVAINLVAFSSDVCFRRCGPFVDFGQETAAVGRFGVSGGGTCGWDLEFWAMIVHVQPSPFVSISAGKVEFTTVSVASLWRRVSLSVAG